MLDPDLAYSIWHKFPSSITIKNTNIDMSANPYKPTGFGVDLVAHIWVRLPVRPDLPERRLFQPA